MRNLKYKGYCVVEVTDDLKQLPYEPCFLYKTKKEAIEQTRSYYGHPCDDPRRRGKVCEVEVTVKVPSMKATPELVDYIQRFRGRPAVLVVGDERWNNHARELAMTEKRRALKIAKRSQ